LRCTQPPEPHWLLARRSKMSPCLKRARPAWFEVAYQRGAKATADDSDTELQRISRSGTAQQLVICGELYVRVPRKVVRRSKVLRREVAKATGESWGQVRALNCDLGRDDSDDCIDKISEDQMHWASAAAVQDHGLSVAVWVREVREPRRRSPRRSRAGRVDAAVMAHLA
jgi:hypothetical protein